MDSADVFPVSLKALAFKHNFLTYLFLPEHDSSGDSGAGKADHSGDSVFLKEDLYLFFLKKFSSVIVNKSNFK